MGWRGEGSDIWAGEEKGLIFGLERRRVGYLGWRGKGFDIWAGEEKGLIFGLERRRV